MLVTTGSDVPGRRLEVLGEVFGLTSAMRFDTSEPMGSATEIRPYGTAVKLLP